MRKLPAFYLSSLAFLIAGPAYAEGKQVALTPASAPPAIPAPAVHAAKQTIKQAASQAYPRTHYQLALYYKQRGDFNTALVEFLRATQENPRLVKAYYEQALLLRQKGYLRLAQSALEQALSVQPDYQQARLLLATISLEQGNINGAVHELSRSLGLPDQKTKPQAISKPEPLPKPNLRPAAATPPVTLEPAPPPPEPPSSPDVSFKPNSSSEDEDLNNILRGIPGIDPDVPETPPATVQTPAPIIATTAPTPPPVAINSLTAAAASNNESSLPQTFARAFGWFSPKRPHLKVVKPRLAKVLKRQPKAKREKAASKSTSWFSRWFNPKPTPTENLAAAPAEPPPPLKFKIPKEATPQPTPMVKAALPAEDIEQIVPTEATARPIAEVPLAETKPATETKALPAVVPSPPKPSSTLIYNPIAEAAKAVPVAAAALNKLASVPFSAPPITKANLLQPLKTNPVRPAVPLRNPPAAKVEPTDQWVTRLKYLAENGTASLKPGEAFMFSEETGEASLFFPNGQIIRRFVAPPRNRQDVAMQRRPDTLEPPEMMYNLSLLGKLLPRQNQVEQPSQAEANPSLQELLSKPDGVWDWFKDRLHF